MPAAVSGYAGVISDHDVEPQGVRQFLLPLRKLDPSKDTFGLFVLRCPQI